MPLSSHRPAGPTPFQLLRKLPSIRDNAPGYLLDAARQYGDMVFFEMPRTPVYFINHPDLIRRVLLDNHHAYNKDTIQYNSLAEVSGRGLLTSDGAFWLRQRRLEQPAFSRQRLQALDTVIVPAAAKMLERWEKACRAGEPLDVDGEMMRLALEIVGKALFSIDLSNDAPRLTEAVLQALDHIVERIRNPIGAPSFLLTPRKMRFKLAISTLDATVYQMIAERVDSERYGDDLLGMLLKARDSESGEPLTREQVRDELITILIAGHETVASALTWTFYLLAKHPQTWEKLGAEVGTVLSGRLPATADLDNLPFTASLFDEALRLYPPAWIITRKAVEADQIGGYDVPPGALVLISPYTIHRHAEFWQRPEEFWPERFVQGGGAQRFAYIPFGGGPRLCIGNQFALIEGRMIIAMVAQRFQLKLTDRPVHMDALVTLRPKGGLHLTVERV